MEFSAMTRRFLTAIALASLMVGLAGCGSGAKSSDPKAGAGAKEDPRLKPAGMDGPSKRGLPKSP
jgi:hypothetical protein